MCKISSPADKNYWTRLRAFKLYSLQRRRERYQIIYLWKVLEGLVPNVNNKITSTLHARLGRKCVVPRVPNGKLGKIREASLAVHGAKLFNVLPKPLRNMSGVKLDTFKSALDRYLKAIPDEPTLVGYTACRRADTNSIFHMFKLSVKSASSSLNLDGADDGLEQPGDV